MEVGEDGMKHWTPIPLVEGEVPMDIRTVTGKPLSSALEAVVYCKDCKKRGFDECPVNGWMPDKADGNWFCADGEMKDS